MSDATHNTFRCPYCGHRQRYMSDEAPDSCCDEREQAEMEHDEAMKEKETP